MAEQLPPDEVIAEQWKQAADALERAHDAWLAVSPDSAGPITELLHSARWNAAVFVHMSHGVPRTDAWRAADAEHPRPKSGYINFDPETPPSED